MTNEEKIKFFDALLSQYTSYINEQADENREPLEFDDEDANGNTVRRYFPTSFRYRQECAAEELSSQSEDIAPFAFDLFEFLGNAAYGFSPLADNQFIKAVKD